MTLPEYLERWRHIPFKWGENDCVLFAARWVLEATGEDKIPSGYRWTNQREAVRALRRLGDFRQHLDRVLRPVHPNLALDGHIGLAGPRTIALFSGRHLVAPGPEGLVHLDRGITTCAWAF